MTIKIKITNETRNSMVGGTWNAVTGTGEEDVIDAVAAHLAEKGYKARRMDILAFKMDGRTMCDDCQSDGRWSLIPD